MGMFDFLRRKPANPEADRSAEGQPGEPRCHHYTFAHHALRSVAFTQPLTLLGVLGSEDAERFLAELLEAVGPLCQGREAQPGFGVKDIKVFRERITGRFPCAIIEMPVPQGLTEAYFVAVVLLHDVAQRMPPEADKLTVRFFTLELGFAVDGPPPTMLCEWTAEGSHGNYGDGPEPTRAAFVDAVGKIVSAPFPASNDT